MPATRPTRHLLPVRPLTASAFQPFGQVIEAGPGAAHHTINEGYAQRFHDLAEVHTTAQGGRTLVNIFRALPRTLPLQVRLLERHCLGSQLFMPLGAQRFLVVVGSPGEEPAPGSIHCFLASPGQGINMRPGTWHHPLLALDEGGDFLVIDRGSKLADDCDVQRYDGESVEVWIEA